MSLAIRLLSDVDGWRCSAAVGKQTGDTVRPPSVRLPDELRIVEYVRVSACGAATPREAMNDMGEGAADLLSNQSVRLAVPSSTLSS